MQLQGMIQWESFTIPLLRASASLRLRGKIRINKFKPGDYQAPVEVTLKAWQCETLHFRPTELIRQARILAARRNTSVSAMLRDELKRLVREDEAYRVAREAALSRLAKGCRLGGGRLPDRGELCDRGSLR